MARIGSLSVNLALEDASFTQGLKRATSAHEKAMKDISGGVALAKTAFAGLAGVVGGVFSVQTIKGALDYAGSIGEVSAALGVSTRDLQVYRFAATQVNLTQEQIEKALAKATLEIGRNNDAFAKLGISTRTASGEFKAAGAILPEIADALQRIESPAERSAYLVEIFGRQGQQLGPLLEGGAAGLAAFADEAERTGQVLSSKAIQDADKAADAIASFQNQLRVSVAGAVAANAAAVASLGEAIGGLITRLGQLIQRGREAWNIANTMSAARGDKEILGGLIRVRGKGPLNAGAFQSALMDNALADAAALKGDLSGAAAPLPGLDPRTGGAARVARAAVKAKAELTEAQKRLAGVGDPEVLQGATASLDEQARLLREIQTIAVNIPEVQPINLEAVALAEDFTKNLVDGLGQAIIYGRGVGDALLASIRAAAAQLVTSGLLKLLNGANGEGGFLSAAITAVGTAFGGARANGGPVSPGRGYLVGERGPEILFPSMSGVVQANGRGMAGAVIHVDARGATDPAMVELAARRGAAMALSAVGDAARRSQRPALGGGIG